MNTIIINRNALKAVSRFAAVKDIRHNLNGVKIEGCPAETRLVAVDGHTLGVHCTRFTEGGDQNTGYCSIIVPAAAIKAVLAWKFGKRQSPVVILRGEGNAWAFEHDGQTIGFTPIDGRFPDYLRVIPSKPSGNAGHYNPAYLCRFQDASMDLGSRMGYFDFIQDGMDGPALATADDGRFVGVVMPMRGGVAERPDWAAEPVAVAVELKIAA